MNTMTKLRQCPNCFNDYDETLENCPFCGYEPTEQAEQYPLALAPGRILAGRYMVGRVLGQGGFGITYLAWDAREKKRVAIKEFFPESMVIRQPQTTQVTLLTAGRSENFQFGKEQFLAEAQTLAQFVDNPNIVGVYSYFEENGTAYFAMEYVAGKSLKEYLKEQGGRLSWEETLRLLEPVMDALEAVHAKGIIHRDIKPDNIIITESGSTKLLDFGSARYSLGDRSRSLDVVLTAGYAPREQYARRSKQGPYTDIYSLAACFYACITGLVPTESVERTEDEELVLPSARGAKLPAEAEEAILKGLSIRAEDRWQTVADFRAKLLAEEPAPEPQPEPTPAPKPKAPAGRVGVFFQRFKLPILAGIGVLVLALGVWTGYSLIPFEVTDHTIRVDNREVGLYTGTIKGGKPTGEGRMEYTDGGVYDGSWEQGQRTGEGTMSYSDENLYTGAWVNDKEDGQGTMNYASGDVYEGDWQDGVRSGEGRIEYADGSVYEGGWQDDMRSGEGTLTHPDGIRVFAGQWAEDEMNGEIVMTLSFNEEQDWVSSLHGTYENGELVGEGVYTAVNGDTITAEWEYVEEMELDDLGLYTGLLVDGAPSGCGSIVYEDETTYTGEFSDGMRNGVGHLDEGDENYYIGEWKEDERDGYGYYHYGDGSIFEGYWEDNCQSGQGSYTYVDGDVVEGDWSYAVNQAIIFVETSDYNLPERYATYSGLLLDGTPSGYGFVLLELWDEDHSAMYIGEWKDGHPGGDGMFLFDNDDAIEGNWSYEQTEERGVLMLNGEANGFGMWEYSNGVYCGEYQDGKANGYGYKQMSDGNEYTGQWRDDKLHGQGRLEFENGSFYEGEFVDGEMHGHGRYEMEDGTAYEGQFENDQLSGWGTVYFSDGSSMTGTWIDGEFIPD